MAAARKTQRQDRVAKAGADTAVFGPLSKVSGPLLGACASSQENVRAIVKLVAILWRGLTAFNHAAFGVCRMTWDD